MSLAMANSKRGVLTFPTAMVVLALAVCPIAIRWGGAGIVDQAATGGFVMAILVFAVAWVMNAQRVALSGPLMLVLALVGVLTMAFIVHGTPAGLALLPRIVLFALAGLCVGAVTVTAERFYVAGKWGVYLTAAALLASSLVANVNLLGGLLEYFTTLNHDAVVFKTYRPIYNAFAGSSDVEYVASVGNAVSAGLAIFVIGIVSHRIGGNRLGLDGWASLGIAGLLLITLFSSTAILVLFLWLATIGVMRFARQPLVFVVLAWAVITLLAIAALMGADPFALITAPLEGDDKSRGARLDQYAAALEVLGTDPLFGVGFIDVGKYNIHNLPLFAWVSGGLVPLLIVLTIYFGLAKTAWDGLRGAMGKSMTARHAILIGLPLVFAARTMFGGGGGLPDMASCLSAGVCFSLLRQKS